MTFSWTPHRFVGGALALDVANSVILRFDHEKSVDRFAVSEQLDSFCEAATRLSAERNIFPTLAPPSATSRRHLIELREATDRYFRQLIETGQDDNALLADLLTASATALKNAPHTHSLQAATARSVLNLMAGPDRARLRICGHCGWLFIDRSKNRSRIWCDMAVCGNRQKAAKHYRRKKETVS
ncbi:CGNR zinc finger domain-containing protein [Agrobacterium sp. BA1120]|uniref:CGNR zinc finger domain-containing protein n=1 Tax=Agrobacterium sp. BA1120 TaxID=3228927 RepID=UPI00336A0851